MNVSWQLRKDGRAVSPIVAVILLLAITIILATMLFVVVMEMGKGSDEQILIGMNSDSTSENWTFSVSAIQGTGHLSTIDVYIIVIYPDQNLSFSAKCLNNMSTGTYYSGVQFVEGFRAGYLNVGDYFTLDRNIYSAGTKITLTDGGMQTYGSWTVK